jgi:gluconolactonase
MAIIATSDVEIFGQGVLNAEGVVADNDGNIYGGGRKGTMYKVSPDGQVSEFARLPEGSIPNGVTMDRNGDIVYCDLGKQAMMRVSPGGKVSMIADEVGGIKLTLPNFATYDAEGNLFVSNSTTRNVKTVREEFPKPEANGSLVRIRPSGKGDVVATGFYLANGLAIDPQEEAVYVLQTTRSDCVRVPLKKDGSFGKPEIYSSGFPAIPDGMAFDSDGNLYVTLPGRIRNEKDPPDAHLVMPTNIILKIDTNGKWEVLVDDPESQRLSFPTNCAFGGPGLKDLYFANLGGTHFSRTRMTVAGHPLYHQR